MVRTYPGLRPALEVVDRSPPFRQPVTVGIIVADGRVGFGVRYRRGYVVLLLVEVSEVLDEPAPVVKSVVRKQRLAVLVVRAVERNAVYVVPDLREVVTARELDRRAHVRRHPAVRRREHVARSREDLLVPVLHFLTLTHAIPDAHLVNVAVIEVAADVSPAVDDVGQAQRLTPEHRHAVQEQPEGRIFRRPHHGKMRPLVRLQRRSTFPVEVGVEHHRSADLRQHAVGIVDQAHRAAVGQRQPEAVTFRRVKGEYVTCAVRLHVDPRLDGPAVGAEREPVAGHDVRNAAPRIQLALGDYGRNLDTGGSHGREIEAAPHRHVVQVRVRAPDAHRMPRTGRTIDLQAVIEPVIIGIP